MDVSVSLRGESREMHPIARDEVYRIGFEAIQNACAHSGGTQVMVELEYDHELRLRVRDDGKGNRSGNSNFWESRTFWISGHA